MPPATTTRQVGRLGQGKTRRTRGPLAERRRRQDRLIAEVIDTLAARDRALEALAAAQTTIDQAAAELTGLGTSGRDLAALLGVPVRVAEQRVRGVARRAGHDDGAGPEDGENGGDGGAIRLWLAMIERGPAPKTHGLDGAGGLLCRGPGDPTDLTTWVGYAFDVDCNRCAKLLADQLTEDEFG